ncbi:hypothetical protein ACFQU7_24170 [Pseudoroseomonas wenyumeiae]
MIAEGFGDGRYITFDYTHLAGPNRVPGLHATIRTHISLSKSEKVALGQDADQVLSLACHGEPMAIVGSEHFPQRVEL